jgi:hypothetical protein
MAVVFLRVAHFILGQLSSHVPLGLAAKPIDTPLYCERVNRSPTGSTTSVFSDDILLSIAVETPSLHIGDEMSVVPCMCKNARM